MRFVLDPLSPSGVSIAPQVQTVKQSNGYVTNNIRGLITAGSNVTLTGNGTESSPYQIAAGDMDVAATWGNIIGTLSNQTDLQTAFNTKEVTITAGTTEQYWRGDKSWQTLDKTAVGLTNVDNTSDASKPISTATQTALDLKAPLASPTFTGTVTGANSTWTGTLDVAGNITNGVTSALNPGMHIGRTGTADLTLQSAGAGARPGISSYASNGTLSVPTATASNDILLFFGGRGYQTTSSPGFAASSTAAVVLRAEAAFTNTSMPTAITFDTTATSSVTRAERARFNGAGQLVIGKTGDVRGKLHLYDSGSSVSAVIGVQGDSTTTTPTASLAFRTRDVSTDLGSSAEIVVGRDGNYSAVGVRSANMQFWVEAGDTLTEAARFDSTLNFTLKGDLSMTDAKNVVVGTTTGTKIGTATTQKLGFWNATPVVRPAAYTTTNVTTDRDYDANATTLDEVADVLGTLIADLKSIGLIG